MNRTCDARFRKPTLSLNVLPGQPPGDDWSVGAAPTIRRQTVDFRKRSDLVDPSLLGLTSEPEYWTTGELRYSVVSVLFGQGFSIGEIRTPGRLPQSNQTSQRRTRKTLPACLRSPRRDYEGPETLADSRALYPIPIGRTAGQSSIQI